MQPVFERVDWLRGRLPDLREFPGHLIDNPGHLLALIADRCSPAFQAGGRGFGSRLPLRAE
jgi:hypothetical protein